jgi:uncharacterized repeat protein (TIGR02543 family)
VAKTGNGGGTVTSSPAGITCAGGDRDVCTRNFAAGATVTLTATPALWGNDTFAGWSGDCSGVSVTCTVSMTRARNVKATFNVVETAAVQIRASALGMSATGNGTLDLTVPRNVKVEVTFSMAGSRIPAGGTWKYVWEIGNEMREEPTLKYLFSAGQYKVRLTLFQLPHLETKTSTPAFVLPLSQYLGAKSAEVSVKVTENDDQACRGRLGRGCFGSFDLENKWITPSQVTQDDQCQGPGTICIKSLVSIGSIKHDACCDAAKQAGVVGHQCRGYSADIGKTYCELPWEQAEQDWVLIDRIISPGWVKSAWEHTWTYRVGTKDRPVAVWPLSMNAETGAVVNQKRPEEDKQFCRSGEITKQDVLVRVTGGTPERPSSGRTSLWVCK